MSTGVKPTASRHAVTYGWAALTYGWLICIAKPYVSAHFLAVFSLIFTNRTQVHIKYSSTVRKCALADG